MREFEANANSNVGRDQAVPSVTADVEAVRVGAIISDGQDPSYLRTVVDASPTSGAIQAYVLRRWSPFALAPENGTALTLIVGVLSMLALAAAVSSRGVEGYGSVAVESDGSPRLIVDVRTAEWTDFAMLPGVGRTLAQRIVEARDAAGNDFSVETFESVRGVGPKTWRRIEPFLEFPAR